MVSSRASHEIKYLSIFYKSCKKNLPDLKTVCRQGSPDRRIACGYFHTTDTVHTNTNINIWKHKQQSWNEQAREKPCVGFIAPWFISKNEPKKKRMECEDLMKRRLKAILKFFYCNCFYLQEKRFELSDPDMHLLACVKRS